LESYPIVSIASLIGIGASGDATSSIMAISWSWVGPPLTFKIYPDARQGSPWHFRAPATPSVPARRDRPLTHRDQAACDRPADWRPMPLPRCCDVAASIPCVSLPRSADLGRRGNPGSGHIALGGGNRRKGLAVSSAWENRPGSQVLRRRNITVFRVYEGCDQAALFNLPTSGGLPLPYQEADPATDRPAPTRPDAAAPTLIRWREKKAAGDRKAHSRPSLGRREATALQLQPQRCPDLRSSAGDDARYRITAEDSVGPNAPFQPVRRPLPIYPDERTCSVFVGMSQRCQQATSHA
jgi:hypothetical protein